MPRRAASGRKPLSPFSRHAIFVSDCRGENRKAPFREIELPFRRGLSRRVASLADFGPIANLSEEVSIR